LFGDVLRRLRHGVGAIGRLHGAVDEAPADRRVVDLCIAPKSFRLFRSTNGARVMLSTPPASKSSASPMRIARAAVPIASSPDPHRRLMVAPGVVTGNPASNAAIRATLRLSSPA